MKVEFNPFQSALEWSNTEYTQLKWWHLNKICAWARYTMHGLFRGAEKKAKALFDSMSADLARAGDNQNQQIKVARKYAYALGVGRDRHSINYVFTFQKCVSEREQGQASIPKATPPTTPKSSSASMMEASVTQKKRPFPTRSKELAGKGEKPTKPLLSPAEQEEFGNTTLPTSLQKIKESIRPHNPKAEMDQLDKRFALITNTIKKDQINTTEVEDCMKAVLDIETSIKKLNNQDVINEFRKISESILEILLSR